MIAWDMIQYTLEKFGCRLVGLRIIFIIILFRKLLIPDLSLIFFLIVTLQFRFLYSILGLKWNGTCSIVLLIGLKT